MYCLIVRDMDRTRAIKCDTLLDLQVTLENIDSDIDSESLVYDSCEAYFNGVSYQVVKLENCNADSWC